MTQGSRDNRKLLRRASWLSFWVGVTMLAIKSAAWWMTRSAAILSDAAESVVHLAAVAFVVYSLRLSQKPPAEAHPYGHAKISFFSAGLEGSLILIAGIGILAQAIYQWINGIVPHDMGWGSLLIAAAVVINGWLGWYLKRIGRKHQSLILESNGQHVLVDAWTSLGVLVGVILVWLTGWMWLDPLCAIFVALHILRGGFQLTWRSAEGLMDRADPKTQKLLVTCLDESVKDLEITWHQMRHRHLGDRHWVDFHLVFDDDTTVRDAHAMATDVESAVREMLGGDTVVTTHLEPKEDHVRIHGYAPGHEPPLADDRRDLSPD